MALLVWGSGSNSVSCFGVQCLIQGLFWGSGSNSVSFFGVQCLIQGLFWGSGSNSGSFLSAPFLTSVGWGFGLGVEFPLLASGRKKNLSLELRIYIYIYTHIYIHIFEHLNEWIFEGPAFLEDPGKPEVADLSEGRGSAARWVWVELPFWALETSSH